MATYYSQGDGAWSTLANWDTVRGGGGSDPASADEAGMAGHTFIIQPGHDIEFDMDMSAWSGTTGIYALTIEGHATDPPGMLYAKYSAAGTYHLMIQGGSATANIISGTNLTNLGRILANSDGVWANSTALPQDRKFIIEFRGTTAGKLMDRYLDVKLLCTQPTNFYVRTYGTKYDFNGATAVDPTNNTIDLGTTPPSADTAVMVIPAAGATLPTPLDENVIYYVRAVSGNTCKLAYYSGYDNLIVDITADGSGTCSLITGHTSTSTKTINILEDLSADTVWVTTAGHNRVSLVDRLPATYDQQRDTLATIDTTDPYSLTLTTNNIDSAQGPGARIYLVSRNVSIRTNNTGGTQPLIDSTDTTRSTGNTYQCEIVNLYQPGTVTTFYGYGISSGYGHTISGTICGFTYGVQQTSSVTLSNAHVISGIIVSCQSGTYPLNVSTISGTICGCEYGVYYGRNCTISGTIFGCSNGFYFGVHHTVSGTVFGCSSAFSFGIGHVVTSTGLLHGHVNLASSVSGLSFSGTVFGCSVAFLSSRQCSLSNAVVYGCVYMFSGGNVRATSSKLGYNSSGVEIKNVIDFAFGKADAAISRVELINCVFLDSPSLQNRNSISVGSTGGHGIFIEHNQNVIDAHKSYLPMGDILRTAINAGGDAPTQNPDGVASGHCIEVSNIQSNCSTTATIEIFSNQQIWLAAGTYTITYKVQTTYSSIASGSLILTAEYISDDSPLTLAEEVENATAITTRSSATDWSQTIAVTITQAADGWVRFKMELAAYEANDELYVWPVPAIT